MRGVWSYGQCQQQREHDLSALRNHIPGLIATLLGEESVCNVEVYDDDLYGAVANITIDLPAKEALELWLKLIDHLSYEDYKNVLSLRWLGGIITLAKRNWSII